MMPELSLHILDIVQNSQTAGARNLAIDVCESTIKDRIIITISDDGRGMDDAERRAALNPFATSRTSRRVGLGLPLFAQTCAMCNGALFIESAPGKGTTVRAEMSRRHIDRPPFGNLADTLYLLFLTYTDIEISYRQTFNKLQFAIDTIAIKKILSTNCLDATKHGKQLKHAILDGFTRLRSADESATKL